MKILAMQGSPCAYGWSQYRPSISGSQVGYDDLHIDLHYAGVKDIYKILKEFLIILWMAQ